MVGLHTLCCGAPLLISAIGLAASAAVAGGILRMHSWLHGYEIWLLAMSAGLAALGGFLEWRLAARGQGRVSWLFVASLGCFAVNAALVAGHRLAA